MYCISGATHSFISNDCAKHIGLPISFLDTSMVVSTPTSKFVITHNIYLNCPFYIENRKFLVDLICLPLSQLYVILGTDWLFANEVLLNYAEKSVPIPNYENPLITTTNLKNEISNNGIQGYLLLSFLWN